MKTQLIETLKSQQYASDFQANQIWDQVADEFLPEDELGEAAKEQAEPQAMNADALQSLKTLAMQKAIKILELDQAQQRLHAETTMDTDKIPAGFHEVSRQLTTPTQYKLLLAKEARKAKDSSQAREAQAAEVKTMIEDRLNGNKQMQEGIEGALDRVLQRFQKKAP